MAPTARRVFAVFLLIYMVTWAGHYTSGDGFQKISWAKALVESGASDIDPGPGVAYSRYGIGHTLLAIPVVAASKAITSMTGVRAEAALYTFMFLVNGAWFLALVARYLRPNYSSAAVWTMACLIGLASTWWPYTKLDYSEPLVATALLWGLLEFRDGRVLVGALISGFAVLIRTDAVLLVACLWTCELMREWNWAIVPKMALAALPIAVVMAAANYARFGSLVEHGYAAESFSNPFVIGLYGILFSAGKSVFLFSPPLLIGCLAWRRFRATPHGRIDAVFFLGVFVIQVLEYSRWWDWSADDSWGDRFLIPGVMLMCLPAVELLSRRWLVRIAMVSGVAVQLLAVLIGGLSYVLLIRAQPMMRHALYVDGTNRADFEDLRFNPRYSQIVGHLLIIRAKLGVPPSNAGEPADMVSRTGTPLYDTLPPDAWRNAAAWDFIWWRH